MTKSPLFQFRHGATIALLLAKKGVDAVELARRVGAPDAIAAGEINAPLNVIQAFVEGAADALDDPLFGFTLAESIPQGRFGLPEVVGHAAPTLRLAMESLVKFAPLVNSIGSFELGVLGNSEARFEYIVRGAGIEDGLGMHLNEYTIWYLILVARGIVGEEFDLERVWFTHKRERRKADVAARFGCNIEWGARRSGFAFPAALLEKSPKAADPVLHEFLDAQARKLVSEVPRDDVVAQITAALKRRFDKGDPLEIVDVARELAMTPRTLQRRLDDVGTTFKDVVDDARRTEAERCIAAGMSLDDVARRLGFADTRPLRAKLATWGGAGLARSGRPRAR